MWVEHVSSMRKNDHYSMNPMLADIDHVSSNCLHQVGHTIRQYIVKQQWQKIGTDLLRSRE